MFHIVAQALINTSDELAKLPEYVEGWDISRRRDVFARLIDGYAKLCDCEEALRAAYGEMYKIAFQNDVATKVVTSSKLAALQHTANAFGDKAIKAFTFQRHQGIVLHSDLFLELIGPKSFWFNPPRVIHLFALTCPETVTENHRATYIVKYPTESPTTELIDLNKYKIEERYKITFEEMRKVIPNDIQARIRYATVDIRDIAQLRAAIEDIAPYLNTIEATRINFSNTIKRFFSLDTIVF